MEPTKCDEWRWWFWDQLPPAEDLFLPLRHLRENGFEPPVPSESARPEGELRRICVFCGSSTGLSPTFVAQAEALGELLASERIGLVYGGGRVGLMGAIADATLRAKGNVTGVIPDALVAAEVAHTGLSDLRVVRSMHERKQLMADLADAFIALPGGFGTFDELFEIVTWAQLGLHAKAIGLLNVEGYFDPLLQAVEHAVAAGFVSTAHAKLLYVENDSRALIARLRSHRPDPWIRKWRDGVNNLGSETR